ncbi:putative F-box protein At3g52320 [Olea europaea var. sylvestris]|uniref:putative F-box protein At3g52320 n=1 Tax=Olea europaea var. sylvestris TaxID=158386 RepID=UPI000C1CD877|nr:putative F-box protein At3g52320 [Olea europaea var. sylvestris]
MINFREDALMCDVKIANWKELPEDLLIEILLMLSVKSLIRFRCVSKTWRELIKSTKFIAMHFECNKDKIVLICRYVQKENQHVISLHSNEDSLSQVSTNVRIPYFDERTELPILGPCNGLICITNYYTIVLRNPVVPRIPIDQWFELFFNGACHISSRRPYASRIILCFIISSEVFTIIDFP